MSKMLSLVAVLVAQAAGASHPVQDCAECPPLVAVEVNGKPLFVARHELTWKEYSVSVKNAGCKWPKLPEGSNQDRDLSGIADLYPMTGLRLSEFNCYLAWINSKTKRAYRLPTPSEWEAFARAGENRNYPWGANIGYGHAAIKGHYDPKLVDRKALYDQRSAVHGGYLLPVESFTPNAWGIYDVIGNASEATTETKRGPAVCYARFPERHCVLIAGRGGDGFPTESASLMVDRRFWLADAPNDLMGFRLVRDK